MGSKRFLGALICGSALLFPGCGGPEAPEIAALPGSVAPELVGEWRLSSGGESTMVLRDDGTSLIRAKANTPGGAMETEVSGEWSVDEGVLHLRRQGPDGEPFVAEYEFVLDGDLELRRNGGPAQTYERVAVE